MICVITNSTPFETWLAAFLTLAVFSFLYRDNPFYKFAEHLFVGVSAAYWMVLGFWSTLWPNAIVPLFPNAASVVGATPPAQRDWIILIPVILGLMMLLKMVPRYASWGNYTTAFIIGTTAGYSLVRYLRSDFIYQLGSIIKSVIPESANIGISEMITNIFILLATISALYYFLRIRTKKRSANYFSRFGLLVLMTAFGVSFGSAVMGRVTLLVDRLHFLFSDWLGIL